MKKLKRLLTIGIAVVLMVYSCVSFSACASFYCNPKGKDWYNSVSLPSILNPFDEIYDGCYSIQIDKDGKVVFNTLDGEEIKGFLTTSLNDGVMRTKVNIAFENGETAFGRCYTKDGGRYLTISYANKSYTFTNERQLSKEEFEAYRRQFIAFLSSVYETGSFPTQNEIENNSLYKKFTNYYQIDPAHGGPIRYEVLEKATIEKVEFFEEYNNTIKEITLTINGETVVCELASDCDVVGIINREMQEMLENDISEGDCLVGRRAYWNGREEVIVYEISKIFYFKNN